MYMDCVLTTQNQIFFYLHVLDLLYPLLPPNPLPFANHHTIVCVYKFLVCFSCLFICCFQFSILHVSEIIWFLTFSVWLISFSLVFQVSLHEGLFKLSHPHKWDTLFYHLYCPTMDYERSRAVLFAHNLFQVRDFILPAARRPKSTWSQKLRLRWKNDNAFCLLFNLMCQPT